MIPIKELNKTEVEYLLSIIGEDAIRKYFSDYAEDFRSVINRDQRIISLKLNQICKIVYDNPSANLIIKLMNDKIVPILEEIEYISSEYEVKYTNEIALVIALSQSRFKNNIPLYFRLIEKKVDDDYTNIISFLVESPEIIKLIINENDDRDLSEQIEKLTKQLEEKDRSIASNDESLHQLNCKLNEMSKQIDDANATISSLQSELDSLKAADQIPEEDIDDGYTYHSLCEVYIDYKDGPKLRRLADVGKSGIIPFVCDKNEPKLFGNRNKIYHKNGPDTPGFIGVWAWNATKKWSNPSTDYILSNYCDNINVIQVVEISGAKKINDMIDIIKKGVEITPVSTKLLFIIRNSESDVNGILFTNDELDINKGIVAVKSSCYSVDGYTIKLDDIIELDGNLFYKYLKIKGVPKMIRLYDPIKIVTDIILKRASWNAIKQKGISKNTWKIYREFIAELPHDDLYKEICEACKCSEAEAQQFIDTLVENAETYINNTTFENDILANIIPNHPDLIDKCKELLFQDWMRDNAEKMAAANDEYQVILGNISEKQTELESVKQEHERLSTELSVISNDISEKEKLASDVDDNIRSRIDDAKKNVAEFISQMAFVTPVTSSMSANSSISGYSSGSLLESDDFEEYDDINKLHSLLSEELQNAGVSGKFRETLAAYMLSAYLNHVPLLLAGPYGKSIANALSAALNARLAGILDCSVPYNRESIRDAIESPDKVIIIEDPFSSEWVYSIMDIISTSDKFFILVTPFIEDLSIEPNGLLNYVMPIFTELFIKSEPTNEFIGSKPLDEYILSGENKEGKREYGSLLSKMKISLFTIVRISKIIRQAGSLCQINEGTNLIYILLPYAYITGNTQKLLESVHNKAFSKAAPEYIKLAEQYLGEYDE